MKVTVLAGISRSAGGISSAVRPLCKILDGQDCALHILAPQDAFTTEDRQLWDPLVVDTYATFGPLKSSFGLSRMLSRIPTDIVHCHGLWHDSQRVALRWQQKTKGCVMISPHGMLDPWALHHSAWKKKLVGAMFCNESLQKAQCLHALCPSEAESIRAVGLENPIAVIPNGVILPIIDSEYRRIKLAADGRRRVLFLGRIHPKKGLSELLLAWQLLLQRRTPEADSWQLIIAGWDDGGHLRGLQKQAIDLGLKWTATSGQDLLNNDGKIDGACLVFCGPVFGAEKDALLRMVDAFILPSFSEGLPMSVLEAWSYQLPILMTDFCNIPEGFAGGAAIRIIPDAESIAKGLKHLVELSALNLHSVGLNGRKLVEQKFQWQNIAQNMQNVYGWLINGGAKPSCVMVNV